MMGDRDGKISDYYASTVDRETRPDLRLAVDLVTGRKIAIDCGCGAGSDIAFLRANGFAVHAFDIEFQSISRCQQRFGEDNLVRISQASFAQYEYPPVSLVVADASLFFCPGPEFEVTWAKITEALCEGGIFAGSFLGPEDTMAGPDRDKVTFWRDTLILSEQAVRSLFAEFEIVSFNEHKSAGKTPQGADCDWHIFSVVAKKL